MDLVAPMAGSEPYLLGSGDVISVSMYGEPDLTRDCGIRPDGTIFLALLRDKIAAAGKTTDQLQELIEAAYREQKLYKNPLVTVSIKEFRSSPVTITGAVSRPATIQVQGHTTLLQAITMAGSVAPSAGTKLLVSYASTSTAAAGQPVSGRSELIVWHDLLDHPDNPNVNVVLRGGDVVTVQRTDYLYVGGAVTKPGMLAMNEVDSWTVMKALVAVGSFTKTAKRENSVIVRKKPDGTVEEIPVDLGLLLKRKVPDITLQANDLLLVPESSGRKALYAAAATLNGMTGNVVTGLIVR
jgi:polysaccharide export outer membrane protein